MKAETNLDIMLASMKPELHEGDYVFCSVEDAVRINMNDVLCSFKEKEGLTIIVDKKMADASGLRYDFIAAWITLTVHSSLEAVGLTAAFSKALSDAGISCNTIAAFYHDHIFVNKRDAGEAMRALQKLSAP